MRQLFQNAIKKNFNQISTCNIICNFTSSCDKIINLTIKKLIKLNIFLL